MIWLTTHWNDQQRQRLGELMALEDQGHAWVAFWCSDQHGQSANGGGETPRAEPGLVVEVEGPLKPCSPHGLHATRMPHLWRGCRLWMVALLGERTLGDASKSAALRREVIGEVLPGECLCPRSFIRCADLRDVDMRGANLQRADLGHAYLDGADMRGANLCGADLSRANLYGADLCGGDLGHANLRCANLQRADLGHAYLDGADMRGANLYGADLSRANLMGANLYGANLRGADLTGARRWECDKAIVGWRCVDGYLVRV